MKRKLSGTRRRFLAFLGASQVSLVSVRSEAQPKQLELAWYSSHQTLGELFADKVAELSLGAVKVAPDGLPCLGVPLPIIANLSDLASYNAPGFSSTEPVFGLSAVPMLVTTFGEAETLLRIARPYYSTALARHGQILLATQPSRPGALWSTFRIRTLGDLKAIAFALQPHSSSGERGAWERPFIRLGARLGSPFDAEAMLSDGFIPSLMFTQNFISLMELFFAVQLCFLTVSQRVFESLSEVQRQFLSAAGRETEIALWKGIGEDLRREHQDTAARGVLVTTQPPADVLAALRTAAEPEIQRWAQSMGADGATILAEYRRAIGRE